MKKTILTTLICSVIVVGVALSGFVIYDRFLNNENEPNNQENNQTPNTPSDDNKDNNEYQADNKTAEWINYLTNQNLTLTKSVWDNANDECVYEKIEISTNDMKNLLNELSTKKITKYYYGATPPTGTLCSDRYKLEYSNYNVSLEADGVMWVNDKSLSNKIDLEVDTTTGQIGEYVYKFDVDFANVINNYIK